MNDYPVYNANQNYSIQRQQMKNFNNKRDNFGQNRERSKSAVKEN
jgi:hypothetical protein